MQFKLVRRNEGGRLSKYWYVTWQESYRSRRRSTGCETLAEAEQWLAEYKAARSRPDAGLTVNDIIDAHETDLEDRNARSIKQIKSHLKFMRRAFGSIEPDSLHETLFTEQFYEWRDGGTSNGTIRTRVLHLRAAFSLAERRKWINKAPFIPAPPAGEERTRYLSRKEFESLYDNAVEFHIRTFLALGVYTGLRNGAILDLKWDNVDFDNMVIIPKGGTDNKRRANVAINMTLAIALGTAWELREGPYVVHWRGNKVGSVKTGFHAAVRRAQLNNVIIHDLRRTCGTWLAIGGARMERIAAVLGDSVAITEKHYAHFSPEYLREEMDILG